MGLIMPGGGMHYSMAIVAHITSREFNYSILGRDFSTILSFLGGCVLRPIN